MDGGLDSQGAYFEDFRVGQEWHTQGRTITEADVVMFAGLSGDYHPMHTDAVFASGQYFGQRVAHGLLGLAVTSGLAMQLNVLQASLIAFRELTCKFSKPILIGDTVHAHLAIAQAKPMPRLGGGLVEFEVRLYNQRDEVVQVGTWAVISRSRNEAGPHS